MQWSHGWLPLYRVFRIALGSPSEAKGFQRAIRSTTAWYTAPDEPAWTAPRSPKRLTWWAQPVAPTITPPLTRLLCSMSAICRSNSSADMLDVSKSSDLVMSVHTSAQRCGLRAFRCIRRTSTLSLAAWSLPGSRTRLSDPFDLTTSKSRAASSGIWMICSSKMFNRSCNDWSYRALKSVCSRSHELRGALSACAHQGR